MAKLTEIVVAIEAEGVQEVLDALKKVDGAQAKIADATKKSQGEQQGALGGMKASWQDMAMGVNQALQIARVAIEAGKAVYNFSKEGAQLDFVAGKFDRLSESVGVTSASLMTDLRSATQGLMSDSTLMQSASDFMSLGLADTSDEVIRLTSVAGQLGMNMNQLVLTLSNKTTMRFDQLGLSVAGFDEKVKALEASGLSANDAFTEAFLQQAEAQIDKVGSIADTSAGQIMKFESSMTQIGDNMKRNVSEPFSDATGWFGKFTSKIAQTGAINQAIEDMADKFDKAGMSGKDLTKDLQGMANIWGNYENPEAISMWLDQYNGALKYSEYLQDEYGLSVEEAGAKTQKLIDTFGVTALYSTTDEWADGIERVGSTAETTADKISEAFATSMIGASDIGANYDAMASDWGTMRKMAEGYDQALTLINANSARQKELEPFKETGGYIDGVWKSAKEVNEELDDLAASSADAEAAMAQMAANMTLSFMQASMGIDGYTESEIDALTQYMVDAGLLSQAAADKMKADYMAAITYANALELDAKIGDILANVEGYKNGMKIVNGQLVDAKTGEVLADISDYLDGLTEADLAELDPKVAEVLADILPYIADLLGLPDPDPKTVEITAKYHDPGFDPDVPDSVDIWVNYVGGGLEMRATGGTVYPGKAYNWNEPGREGELLIPEQYGRVLSNHEVAQVMREALMGGGAESRNNGGQRQVVNNYNYVLNMPTSSNPADVRTAFELMEAWN